MSIADTIRTHTARVLLARAAYNADRAVDEGTCAVCHHRPIGKGRRCHVCVYANRKEPR